MRRRPKRLALVLLGALLAAAVGGPLAWASFTKATSAAQTIATGTLAISSNSTASALISLTSGNPNNSTGTSTGCIKVTYTGTTSATVRLYATVTGTLAPFLTLTVTRGTDSAPSYPSCTNFTADATNYLGSGAGVIYTGLLSAYPTTYAAGVVDPTSGSPATWTTSTAHSYKFTITMVDKTAAVGLSSTATFIWEARNSTGSK